MIPLIEAIAINKKIRPTTQSPMIMVQPIVLSTIGMSGLGSSPKTASMRCANPNNSANQLTKSEKRRIITFRKYDSRITGNFITSNDIKDSF
jgi:hypothetical protein